MHGKLVGVVSQGNKFQGVFLQVDSIPDRCCLCQFLWGWCWLIRWRNLRGWLQQRKQVRAPFRKVSTNHSLVRLYPEILLLVRLSPASIVLPIVECLRSVQYWRLCLQHKRLVRYKTEDCVLKMLESLPVKGLVLVLAVGRQTVEQVAVAVAPACHDSPNFPYWRFTRRRTRPPLLLKVNYNASIKNMFLTRCASLRGRVLRIYGVVLTSSFSRPLLWKRSDVITHEG